MAGLTSCLCCSLLTGSIMIGIISTFLYGLAFALELWLIVEADVSLSVPAYILTIGYLLMSLLSFCMVVSLRTKWSAVLLAWLLMMVIYIFPEAGLVLFMSIYHWAGQTAGIIEISLWLVRVFFNVCGIVCVQSLWRCWREEKSIFRSLHELSIVSTLQSTVLWCTCPGHCSSSALRLNKTINLSVSHTRIPKPS